MSKRPGGSPTYNNNDDDNESSFDDLSEETIPHAKVAAVGKVLPARFAQAGAPLAEKTFVEIGPLRQRRLKDGVLPDDGSTRRDDNEADHVAGIKSLYGREWLDEAIARRRMLEGNVDYKFAFIVAGGHNRQLSALIAESEVSNETRRRIAAATEELLKRRSQQQDTRGEQDRAKDLRRQITEIKARIDSKNRAWNNLLAAGKCVKNAVDFLVELPILFPAKKFERDDFALIFEQITKSLTARFGPRGYEQGRSAFASAIALLHNSTLAADGGDVTTVQRLLSDMPNSSTLAFYWSVLFGVFMISDFLERATKDAAKQFSADSFYAKNPAQYAADLRSLAQVAFRQQPQLNLLILDDVTIYFWTALNTLIERSGVSKDKISQPTVKAASRATASQRRQNTLVNGITVVIDVRDEDLRAAIAGQDTFAVDRDKLAEYSRNPYTNTEQPRTLLMLVSVLEPFVKMAWNSLFYTKTEFDNRRDEEAFAGGYYKDGLVFTMFDAIKKTQAGRTESFKSIAGLLVVANKLMEESKVAVPQGSFVDVVAGLGFHSQGDLASLKTVVETSFPVSDGTKLDYQRRVLVSYARKYKLLHCVAEAIKIKAQFGVTSGLTSSDLAIVDAFLASPDSVEAELPFVRLFSNTYVSLENQSISNAIKQGDFNNVATGAQQSFIEAAQETTAAEAEYKKEVAAEDSVMKTLVEQEKNINQRIENWTKLSLTEEQRLLSSIIKEGVGVDPNVQLQTINTGYMFFTPSYTAALTFAYEDVTKYVACLARVYKAQELIESEVYQAAYAQLVKAELRIDVAGNPDVWKPDANERRSRRQLSSALESLREHAVADRGVRHWHSCGCAETTNISAPMSVHALSHASGNSLFGGNYPLAPSLFVRPGTF